MFILRPICLLSSYSYCSICCGTCGVSVNRNMSSAKRRLERNVQSIFTSLFSQFNILKMLSNVAVNSLGEMVSPCTPLLILMVSLSLCRCTLTVLSVYMSFRIYMYTSYIVLAMMSILLGLILSRIPSRNPRRQHTQWNVVFTALLFKLVYSMYVIYCRVLAPNSCLFSRLIFI